MRTAYTCVICGVHYLPPETMVYPETGIAASPAHCASPACTEAARAGEAGLPLDVLETMALAAAAEQRRLEAQAAKLRGRRARAGRR